MIAVQSLLADGAELEHQDRYAGAADATEIFAAHRWFGFVDIFFTESFLEDGD